MIKNNILTDSSIYIEKIYILSLSNKYSHIIVNIYNKIFHIYV